MLRLIQYAAVVAVIGNIAAAPISSGAAASEIYIDSVPRGATVIVVPKEHEQGAEKTLGKTPLKVDSAQTPSMRFAIVMDMDYFMKQVENVADLHDWSQRFKSDRYFGDSEVQRYFSFDTPFSRSTETVNHALVAIGPIYDVSSVDDSRGLIRICALFIPRGVKREAFFPLMPPPGTFPRLAGRWPEILRKEYHLTDEQADVAVESMSRAGKYVVTVKDPFLEGRGRMIAMTELPDGTVVVDKTSMRLIPGYNDLP